MKSSSKNMFLFLMRTAWTHAGSARPRMVLFYVLLIIANIVVSFQPMVLAQMINGIQKEGINQIRDILLWSALYGGLTIIFWALHGPARVIERRVAFHVYKDFVASLYAKVTEMPLRWHQDHHSGGTINRVNKAGRALFLFAESQFVIIQHCVRFTASLFVLGWYSWWVALVSILSTVIVIATVRQFDKRLIPLIRATNEREHRLNAALYDYIGNIITVLTLRLQSNTRSEIDQRFSAMKPSFWPQTLVNEGKWGTISILLIIMQSGIMGGYIGLHLWLHRPLVIGSVVAIFQCLVILMQIFFQATMAYEQLMNQHTDVHGIDGLIESHAQLGSEIVKDKVRSWSKIQIRDLHFTHHEGEDVFHHLRQISLDIKAGQKIALIGFSGSGKTTLLTLLRGLYEAPQVMLTIDGDVFENLMPLAGFTTLVPQDTEIFENTVQYNLTLGTEVPDATIEQALHITTFDEVVPKMPEGIYTDIRERGVNLSGGQKQRLALTRGLIAARHSSLLLLDEPSSSVDLTTEGLMFDRLFASFPDKTMIASIHRLHLLPRFDHIVLMRDGEIVEQGAFNELLDRHGVFSQLWQHHLSQNKTAESDKDALPL